MYGKFIKHPIAVTALSQILLRGWPKMGGKKSVQNAGMILDQLHQYGLQVGPAEGFGEESPRERPSPRGSSPPPSARRRSTRVVGDPFAGFAEELAKVEAKKPWEIR